MALEVFFKKRLSDFTLSCAFHAGEGVTALLGASGSGKSMALKCIAGIEKPDEGRIALDGKVLFDSEKRINLPPQKRHVGLLFQDYALFPNMTVRQNVGAGMGRKPDPDLVEQYLARFHVQEYADRYPGKLSGGERQRAAMARLMAAKPEAILLDEPFSALDSHLKWQLELEMKASLSEEKCPVIFVTHDRDEVYHLADTVCCMDRGTTEEPRELHDFFRNPGTKTAARLSGCKNISPAAGAPSGNQSGEPDIILADWGIRIPGSAAVPRGCTWAGIRAHHLHAEPASPDDVRIPVTSPLVQEDPFEWTLFFRPASRGKLLQWKVPKAEMPVFAAPEALYLSPSDIMWLKD